MENKEKKAITVLLAALSVLILIHYVNQINIMNIYAATVNINVTDELGLPVIFDENNYTVNAGSVTFYLNESALKEGECFIFDDGGIISEVNNGKYKMEEAPEGEIRYVHFFIKGEEGMRPLTKNPFIVEFADMISTAPDVSFKEAEGDSNAYVEVGIRPFVNTFLVITDKEKTVKRHITGKTRVELSNDGVYRLSVYTMDGKGNRTYSKKLPSVITVDTAPPVIASIGIDKPVGTGDRIISREPVTVELSAYDEISGVEGIYFDAAGKTGLKADKLTINPPFNGGVYFWARDNAGNATERMSLEKNIIVDDVPPEISVENKGFENGILTLALSADDDQSGVKKLTASFASKTVFESDGNKKELILDLKNLEYGQKKISLTACDSAGNKAEAEIEIEKSDNTPPQISFLGVADKGVYGADTDVYVNVSDDSERIASYKADVFVRDGAGNMIYSQTTDARNIRITQSGIVNITVSAVDGSGNTSERSVSFIVDKDAPFINGVEKYDGKVFEEFSLGEETADMIDDLSYVTYDIFVNGLEYGGERISREGRYVLKVTAKDEFGNESEKRADFTIKSGRDEKKENAEKQVTEKRTSEKQIAKRSVSSDRAELEILKKAEAGSDGIYKNGPAENMISGNKNSSDPYGVSKNGMLKDAENTESHAGFFDRIKYAIMRLFNIMITASKGRAAI